MGKGIIFEWNEETTKQAIDLREQGFSYLKIAKKLGTSDKTVGRLFRKLDNTIFKANEPTKILHKLDDEALVFVKENINELRTLLAVSKETSEVNTHALAPVSEKTRYTFYLNTVLRERIMALSKRKRWSVSETLNQVIFCGLKIMETK